MKTRNIVVVGSSAGGVEALKVFVRNLPASLPASIFVVNHFPSDSQSNLEKILAAERTLPCSAASNGGSIEPGRIYVAPPGYHLLLAEHEMALVYGPRENRQIPSIDALFRSAAVAFGPRVIGVLLSGTHYDGVAGMEAIAKAGGIILVQEPLDAMHPELPLNAIRQLDISHSRPAAELASLVAELVGEQVMEGPVPSSTIRLEAEIAAGKVITADEMQLLGDPSSLICPECGGALWNMRETEVDRFRCHVGHAFAAEELENLQGRDVERALWFAMRTLEDKRQLYRTLADAETARKAPTIQAEYVRKAEEAGEHAGVLRALLSQWSEHHTLELR